MPCPPLSREIRKLAKTKKRFFANPSHVIRVDTFLTGFTQFVGMHMRQVVPDYHAISHKVNFVSFFYRSLTSKVTSFGEHEALPHCPKSWMTVQTIRASTVYARAHGYSEWKSDVPGRKCTASSRLEARERSVRACRREVELCRHFRFVRVFLILHFAVLLENFDGFVIHFLILVFLESLQLLGPFALLH